MEAADWVSLGDEGLLERRISKLGLRLEGTTLEPLIKQLYDELSAKGLVFHPPCYVGDEWFEILYKAFRNTCDGMACRIRARSMPRTGRLDAGANVSRSR